MMDYSGLQKAGMTSAIWIANMQGVFLQSRDWMLHAILYFVLAWLVGCAERDASSTVSPEKQVDGALKTRPSLTLRVLVVNDPQLLEAVNRLRWEWEEHGIGKLEATAGNWPDIAKAGSIDADVIVYPSRFLGELCARNLLRPVRTSVLENEMLDSDDWFPVVRQDLIKWDGQVMALPLGVQPFLAGANPQPGKEVPSGLRLLSQVAQRVDTSDRLGILFELETMKPRIAKPEFVAALAEMVSQRGGEPLSANNSKKASQLNAADLSADDASMAFPAPVLGFSDRLASVTATTRNATSAFKLLAWLASAEVSTQLAAADGRTMPVRRSLATSAKWYGSDISADERTQLAESHVAAMTSESSLMIPRVPGVEDYLAALNDSVDAALVGSLDTQAALVNVDRRWEEITNSLGRSDQRDAYSKHLNLSDQGL